MWKLDKEMKKFSVGDRVAVYNHRGRVLGRVDSITNGFLDVSAGSGHAFSPHPKQCRLLKKKERRSIWVNPKWLIDPSHIGELITITGPSQECTLEFREVKK